jgi:hypothetical protein
MRFSEGTVFGGAIRLAKAVGCAKLFSWGIGGLMLFGDATVG